LGAGGVQPIASTIVGDIYTPIERARVQGLLSSVFGVSAVVGPSLGALVVQYGAWPVVFWMNLPIGAAAVIMIALFLPEDVESRPRRVDYLGSLLLLLTIAALMLLLLQGTEFNSTALTITAAILVLSGVALTLHERRIPEPMLPLELWRDPVIAGSSIGSLTTGILMMGVTAYLPAYVQGVMGYGAHVTAVILAAMAVVWVLGSTTAGLSLPRASYRGIAASGALMLIAGAAALISMTPTSGQIWAGAAAVLIGAGMGFCNTTFLVSVQTSVAWHQRGAATSSIMFLRFLGQALGAALFGAVLNASLYLAVPASSHPLDQIMGADARTELAQTDLSALIAAVATAMRHAYVLTGVMALLALLLALNYPARLGPANQKRLNQVVP
jgi:predicted MFS family arabinose efflux permease